MKRDGLRKIALGIGLLVALGSLDSRAAARRTSGARALHVYDTRLPSEPREQATRAIAADAWRRERRFEDAAHPGQLFEATRVAEWEIETGLWPAGDLFEIGAQLFHATFTPEIGYGGKGLPPFSRIQNGRRGGPDARRCVSCHWRGGPGGAGDGADNAYLDGDGEAQRSALERNPIALSGAGYVELVAREMTVELASRKESIARHARSSGHKERGELTANGVSFGFIEVDPAGAADYADLAGVDPDLVVKPFGWKGTFATLRDVVEDELNVHHGMESEHLAAHAPAWRVGPFGAPDPDGDGVVAEITEGQLTALTLFVAMQEVPQTTLPLRRDGSATPGQPGRRVDALVLPDPDMTVLWSEGRARFEQIGCAACHKPALALRDARFVLGSRGGGEVTTVDLARSGAEPRIAEAEPDGTWRVELYSDLRRHRMSQAQAESRGDRGVPNDTFLTRPLWGVARTAPYMHDGRAATLEDAILLHGGEGQAARNEFLRLPEEGRAQVRVFLTSLTRARRIVVQ